MESQGRKTIEDLNKLYMEAVYGGKKEEPKDTRHVVTRADKTGNTPAYQRLKAGDKNYKAADHLKDDKDWGYDKEGNSLNPVDIEKKKKKDDDLAGSPRVKKESKEVLTNLRTILEKQKDTPDQVKAVIAFDKARKGTDDATYDSEHGDKKQAKKERDYAKWQRDKGAEDAQKSGHPWEHAKGTTRQKEGKKSEKQAHIKDSFEPSENIIRLIESGKFSDAEIAKIADIQEADIADILARLEKKRISKGGNPDDSPLPAMKKYHAKKKKVKKGDWIGPPPKKTNEEVVLEKDLSAAERRALPDKEFALPGKGKGPEGKQAGSYPIPDEKHARSALSLVSQHGTPEEKAKVRAKVEKKFPGIKVSGK